MNKDIRELIYDKYIYPIEGNKKKYVGVEIELPIVNRAGLATDHNVSKAMFASLIGLIPNCGASVMISSIYAEGVITFGTAMAGLLTNSGLALLVLFRQNKNIKENLKIMGLIYILGILFGYIFNIIGIAL